VRSALRKLTLAGLIESRPGVGRVVVRSSVLDVDTRPVGLVYRRLGDFAGGTSRSIPALEAEMAARGRALMIGSSGDKAEGEDACIRRFCGAGACALIVAPATSGERSHELGEWIKRGRPAVLEGHPGNWALPAELAERCDRVDVNNRAGVRLALQYLLDLGHRRASYLTFGSGRHSERLAGFVEAARELGMEVPEEGLMVGVQSAGKALHLWHRRGRPGAVLCSDDDTALGFIAAARSGGIQCPRDVSVMGFGNESIRGAMALCDLTTVEHSRADLAREIAGLLESRLSGERRTPRTVTLPTGLLVRSSCARPRAAARA
jgi:DNA-binding LacI/PurR family transcriptional regulator